MNYFENIGIFSSMSLIDKTNLSDFCQLQNLKAGEVLFYEWDEPQAIYLILSGKLQVQKLTQGVNKDVAFLEAGNLVGEMAFFDIPPYRSATVTAVEDTQLVVMLQFSIQQMLEKYPDLYKRVSNIIQERRLQNKSL